MSVDLIDGIIKVGIINIYTYATFFKITNERINVLKTTIGAWISLLFYVILKLCFKDNVLLVTIMSYCLQILIQKILLNDKEKSIIVSNLIANALVYSIFLACLIVEFVPISILKLNNRTLEIIIGLLMELLILGRLAKNRRIKNGISFLKDTVNNDYICIIMLNIAATVMFAYCIYGSMSQYLITNLFIVLILSIIIMILMIQKTLTIYYKQKLLAKNIEDYKSEIALKDAQIKSLSDEKYKISKLNHEFYNRQKALIHKVEEITSMNTEIADELDLSKQINDLTKEYTDKAQEIKTLDKLPTTGIVEIDDMFKYMQSECDSKKIQFNLKINGNIYHMINNKIPQSRLVTLIGDHLRDAIIAIDFSNNTFKSILAVLGENNGVYEFCVFDTGIEFKIDTLLNLGLKPATTHKDSGGTGIGFMTTFETMKETKASLIIDEMREMSNTDYTKSVTIRFDGKNEYRIKSYRSDEIKKKMKDNRIIIENKKGSSTVWN